MAATTVRLTGPPGKTLHPLLGFGAQLNADLFTAAGQPQPLTASQLSDLRAAIGNLKLGHSRIFVPRGLRPDTAAGKQAPAFTALMNTIQLAQDAGANVNLTWWGQGPYGNEERLRALQWPNRNIRAWPQAGKKKWPDELTNPAHPNAVTAPRVMMRRFAQIIEEARRRGFSCVTHATIQNEVNGVGTDIAKQGDPGLAMRFYELLYRHFDEALRAIADPADSSRTLRDSVQVVGGDLLARPQTPANSQDAWLKYMHANMEVPREGFDRVLDGYSIHLYWEPGDGTQGFPQKLQARLKNLEQTIRNLPSTLPVYVTEYGVRNLKSRPRPGSLHGTKMEKSPDAAFQHAWFNALAPQYGCAGLVKWALYRTEISHGWGEWGMIDAASKNFERSPVYRVTRLYNHVAEPGWLPAGLARSTDDSVISSKFVSPSKDAESLVVLNSGAAQDVRVDGLTPQRRYFASSWNRDGMGALQPLNPVTADGGGTATVTVPRHGIVALSSRQLGL